MSADQNPTTARDAAWGAYQDRLGNHTTKEEADIEHAFKSGWQAALTKQVPLDKQLKAARYVRDQFAKLQEREP